MAIENGQYISVALSEYIKQWVSPTEIKSISREHDLSLELGRLLVYRNRKVTENNLDLINAILKKAIANRNNLLPDLEKTHKVILKEYQGILTD